MGTVQIGRETMQQVATMPSVQAALLAKARLVFGIAQTEGVQLATYCQSLVHAATWRRALGAMQGFDRRAALGHIAAPSLLVAGEHDRVTPPDTLASMAQAIPGAQLLSLPGAGHLPHLEQPDAFDEALINFLRTARRKPLH